MRNIIILFIALFSVACTPLVSVTQLNDRTYSIQSQNIWTDYNTVSKYALLKAADICIEKKFTKFVILDEQVDSYSSFNALRVYFFKYDEQSPPDASDCEIISNQLAAYRD